jgi:hypothetical protein
VTHRLLPDLDDDLTAVFIDLEETLLSIAAIEDADEPDVLPPPLHGEVALQAVRRLWEAIYPTQGKRAAEAGLGRMLAPDGQYEHMPLRLVDVDLADAETLAQAATRLGDPRAEVWITDAMPEGDLAAQAARLAEMLSAAEPAPAERLRRRLAVSDPRSDVRLTDPEEAWYQHTATWLNRMWASGDPLERFRY